MHFNPSIHNEQKYIDYNNYIDKPTAHRMPVYSIMRLDTADSRILQEQHNLEDFSIFSRSSIKTVIRGMARDFSTQSGADARLLEIREKLNEATEIKIITQCRVHGGVGKRQEPAGCERIVIITDGKYSSAVAQQLLLSCFTNSNYEALIKEYRHWEEKDICKKIEEELARCNVVVVEGLSQILERGESLSDLVSKSEHLNMQTKLLFKAAKKKNSCC